MSLVGLLGCLGFGARRHRDHVPGRRRPSRRLLPEWPGGPCGAHGGAMVTVGANAVAVERRLVEGRLVCPACGARLTGRGRARARVLRGLDGPEWLRPR